MPRRKAEDEPTRLSAESLKEFVEGFVALTEPVIEDPTDEVDANAEDSKPKTSARSIRNILADKKLSLSTKIRSALVAPDGDDPAQKFYKTEEDIARALRTEVVEVKVARRRFIDELLYPRYGTSVTSSLRSDLPVIRSMYPGQNLTPEDLARIILGELPTPRDPSEVRNDERLDPEFNIVTHLRRLRKDPRPVPLGTSGGPPNASFYEQLPRRTEK